MNPDFATLVSAEESDLLQARLSRVAQAHRGGSQFANFAYPEEQEPVDYYDERGLQRIVEDLQFGHDMRM